MLSSQRNELHKTESELGKPDFNGFYSLVMPNEYSPSSDPVDLEFIFGQAGDIQDINITKGYTFIRYSKSQEAAKALELFAEEYHLQLPRNSNKTSHVQKKESLLTPDSPPVNGKKDFKPNILHENGSMKSSDKIDLFIANIENEEDFNELIKPYQPSNVKVINKDHKIFAFFSVKTIEVADRMIKELNDKVQNTKRLYVTYNKNMKSPGKGIEDDSQSVCSMKNSDKIDLFIANIENEEDFNELIKPYQPSNVKVINKDHKIFAFLSVKTIEVADRMIKELNDKVQNTKRLYVTYNKNMKSPGKGIEDDSQSIDSGSSNLSNNSFTSKRTSRKYQSPVLENGHHKASSDFSGMPKLVRESELPNSEDKYRLCWCIFISNFPPYSLESTLRNVFENYHVLDMCIENNSSHHGLTKATLYLATVYDVIGAIREMNGFSLEGHKLLVSVPYSCKLERQVVYNALQREKKTAE